jgi:photosystem II stability/assembly factor-like uncharacterized protein
MKRHFSSQLTFILSMVAFALLLSHNFTAAEKQWAGFGLKGMQVSAIAIDSVKTNTLYVGTQRGAFRTTDGGSNWICINKSLKNTDVLSLVIDPAATQTLYAGTIDGLYKSTDGGNNWIVSK